LAFPRTAHLGHRGFCDCDRQLAVGKVCRHMCMIRSAPLAVVLVLAPLLAPVAKAASDFDAKPPCPTANAEVFPFDGLKAVFDSPTQDAGPDRVIWYCVEFPGAKQEYLVDWPDSDIRDVATDHGIVWTKRLSSPNIHVVPSSAYIGVNRTLLHPAQHRQEGAFIETIKELVTLFRGSVPSYASSTTNRSADLTPLHLRFEARMQDDGVAGVAFLNEADTGGPPVRFEFTPAVQLSFPELGGDFALSAKSETISYRLGSDAHPVGVKTSITFVNERHQALASLPVDIIVPAPAQNR
jgi:hypothetical protein